MAIDRAEAIKKAEKLLRQGRLDLAIAEYARIIEEQPRDWNTRNTLGDLYVRANDADKAVAQYQQIADHLLTEGFLPKAAAIYKKILKIKPDDEAVQLKLAEISAKQGLLADAKAYFTAVAAKRTARGDRAGSDEITIRLGTLDPADFDARALAARTLSQKGDAIAAAIQYRSMHADLTEKGRIDEAVAALREAVRLNHDDLEGRAQLALAAVAAGDLDGAKDYLDRAIAGDDPTLLMTLLEIEIRAGHLDPAREILAHLLRIDPSLRSGIVELAWKLGSDCSEGAFLCVDTAVDVELAAHDYTSAAAILQEFVARVPGQIGALLKLVEICVDGRLAAAMYETQAHLADAYLERGQAAEARVIAEDLVAREPWEQAHIVRFRRALEMLGVPNPDEVIADRLSGHGPFIATDPFVPADPFAELEPMPESAVPDPAGDGAGRTEPEPVAAAPVEQTPEPESAVPMPEPSSAGGDQAEFPRRPRGPEPDIPLRPRLAGPDIPLRPRVVGPDIPLRPRVAGPDIPLRPRMDGADIPLTPRNPGAPPADAPRRTHDIDLTSALAELQGVTPAPDPPAAPPPAAQAPPARPMQSLDEVFNEFRSHVSQQSGANDATEHLTLAKTYLEMGMTEEAMTSLTVAARAPTLRFEAASMLARLYLKKNEVAHAIEWLERAAEAPAPGVNEGRELLYTLGVILETCGETARALAVFLELQADAADYRDVAARAERLARVQTGG